VVRISVHQSGSCHDIDAAKPTAALLLHALRITGITAKCALPDVGMTTHLRSNFSPAGMQVAGAPGLGHLHMQPQPGLGGGDYSSVGGALAAMRAAMSGLTVCLGLRVFVRTAGRTCP
jgi:hypothetical protein